MTKKKFLCVFVINLLFLGSVSAQDTAYVRKIVDTLASESFFGRGYLKDGCKKSAEYLKQEMQNIGLQPVDDNYLQDFSFLVNTFPEAPVLTIDGRTYRTGYDYIMPDDCPSFSGEYPLIVLDSTVLNDSVSFCELKPYGHDNDVIVIRLDQIKDRKLQYFVRDKADNDFLKAKAYVLVNDRYTIWSVASEHKKVPVFQFTKEAFPDSAERISFDISSRLLRTRQSNVAGILSNDADKTIAFTAHYDHLGGIGDSLYFPGAHDNASGVAMSLDLARHFRENPPGFNVLILLFAGEEAGLLGSSYYVQDPLLPLDDIDFVINLDMVGTGEKGISIINAADSAYTEERELFQSLNESENFLEDIAYRKVSSNSDHYPFHEKGVKSVFIYSRGGESYYHNVQDRPSTVSLGGYYGIFQLITSFTDSYVR